MATTVTLDALTQRIVKNLWPGKFPLVATTTSAGTDVSLVIAAAAYSSSSVNAYDGVSVYCPSVTTGIKTSRVTRGGFTVASGTFTMSPAYGSIPGSAASAYFLYGLHANELLEAANEVLRTLILPRYLVLSLVNDANMEDVAADAATDWPDETGTPTQTKETTIVLTGKQSLKLVIANSDDSVRSLSVPVTEGEQLNLSTPIKVTAGSLRVQLYDVTNSAEIDGSTVDEEAWTEVRFQAAVPNNCQNVQVRYIAKTASTTAYVDYCGLTGDSDIYALPDAVYDAAFVEDVLYLPAGFTSEAEQSYAAFSEALQPWPYYSALRDYAGVNSHRIQVLRPWYPLFVKFHDSEAILAQNAGDTNTTAAPEELLVEGALSDLCMRLSERSNSNSAKADYARRSLRHAKRYHSLLESIGLGRPRARLVSARRVAVA